MRYAHLAARLYNTPLMIEAGKAAVIESVLRGMADGAPPDAESIAPHHEAVEARNPRETGKRYTITAAGTAIIPIHGTLVHRTVGLDALSGLTSYTRLQRQIDAATEDSDVRGILLEIDSPGGEVAGLFDLADRLMAAREAKPVWAIANEAAYSAAYAIASAAQRLVLPRSAMVGSIGVLAMHVDQSEKDRKQGMAYTPIYAGDRKIDFNPHRPLSDDARGNIQAEVDRLYDLFVDHVATARGISADAVRATEAGIFSPEAAIDIGLADSIATLDDTVTALEATYTRSLTTLGGITMPTDHVASPGGATDPVPDAIDAARADGEIAGRQAERERIAAILRHKEAESRQGQALAMALDTDLTPEQAAAVLAAAPKEVATIEATAGPSEFERHMAAIGNPPVAPDASEPDPDAAVRAGWSRSIARIAGQGVN